MIPNPEYNIWEHSQNVVDLYGRRAEGFDEMDASAQCAELLAPYINEWPLPGPPRLLDAGCGSGYLYHSFKKRRLAVDYHGLDYSPSLIDLGRRILPPHGLSPDRLICESMENVTASADIITILNTLTFCPDFRAPLDRLAATGAGLLLIRDNFGPETMIRWEVDGFLNRGYNHLKAYWNQWSISDVSVFLNELGYKVRAIEDKRTGGRAELVVGKVYHWSWLLAEKI